MTVLPSLILTAAIAAGIAAQPPAYTSCTLKEEIRYDWRLEASPDRLTLTPATPERLVTVTPASGVRLTGPMRIDLVSDGGLDQMRLTPPQIALFGLVSDDTEMAETMLYLTTGSFTLPATRHLDGYYVFDAAALDMLANAAPLTPAVTGGIRMGTAPSLPDRLTLIMVRGDQPILTAQITTFLLEEGLAQWDDWRGRLAAAGCLAR